MKKRNGFVSIEMLLIVGLLIAGLGAVFATNKKVEENLTHMKFNQEFNNIITAIDSQKQKYNGYPEQSEIDLLGNSKVYNEGEHLIKYQTGQRWDYQTITLTEYDDIDYASGLVLVRLTTNMAPEISESFVLDAFKKKCVNGKKDIDIQLGLTISRPLVKTDWCLLKQNVKIFKPAN